MAFIISLVFLHKISDNRPDPTKVYFNIFDIIYYFVEALGTCFVTISYAILAGIFNVALVFPL
mgnify:CR=1 FL=1